MPQLAQLPSLAAARAHAVLAVVVALALVVGGLTLTASLAYSGALLLAALTSAATFAGFYFTQREAFDRLDRAGDLARARRGAEQLARAIPSGTRVMPEVPARSDARPIRTPDHAGRPARPAVSRLPGVRVEDPVSVSGAFRAAVASVPALPTPRGARPERTVRAAAQDPGRHRPETLSTTSVLPAVRTAR